jgi:hypothetical protein
VIQLSSNFAIFLDLCMVVLLIATIIYAVSLDRSLAKLRDGKAELGTLLGGLSEAVTHADVSITGMKAVAGEYDSSLSRQIGIARALVDELQVINETANNMATRIERAVQSGRAATARPADIGGPAGSAADPMAPLLNGSAAGKPSKPAAVNSGSAGRSKGVGSDRELIEAIELLRRAN